MRRSVEAGLFLAAALATLQGGRALTELTSPRSPLPISSNPVNPEKPRIEVFEEFTLKEFLTESKKLEDNPNLFLGRKIRVTLEQKASITKAIEQQEIESVTEGKLVNYIIRPEPQIFFVVYAPENQVHDAQMLYENTVLEMEGQAIQISYQSFQDRYDKLTVPILVAKRIIFPPPKPELALANQ